MNDGSDGLPGKQRNGVIIDFFVDDLIVLKHSIDDHAAGELEAGVGRRSDVLGRGEGIIVEDGVAQRGAGRAAAEITGIPRITGTGLEFDFLLVGGDSWDAWRMIGIDRPDDRIVRMHGADGSGGMHIEAGFIIRHGQAGIRLGPDRSIHEQCADVASDVEISRIGYSARGFAIGIAREQPTGVELVDRSLRR